MPSDAHRSLPLRAAVVGCGDISAQHAEAIAAVPEAVLAAVVDTDGARREAARRRYGVPGYASLGDLLAAGGIDVVHLCTPHSEHAGQAVAALAAGVHVLTEKPLAHTLEGAEAVVAAARAVRGRASLGVCFQNRYNAPVRALAEVLASGAAGRILGAHATVFWHRGPEYYAARPWRGTWAGSGGGLLMNQAIHTLDLLQWLLGPARVVAGSASNLSLGGVIEVEDTAQILLEHAADGMPQAGMAHDGVGRAPGPGRAPGAGQPVRSVFFATNANGVNAPVAIEIETEEARLSLCGDLTVRWADGRIETVEEAGALPGGRSYWGASHRLLIADFYRSVAAGVPFWIDAEAAAPSLRLIKDLYARSYALGPWASPVA
ncbi:Gfo/Idh/MocA family oxidoreductase [Sinomonas halotolerans]|uniref:Gfo/Idh/MocA family oxidoreductase n=1 Tax=Sinomonas halotolerans TaxID=1644133 RepID=A0ABU9WXH8_9MICC